LSVRGEVAPEGGFFTFTVSLSTALDQAFTVNFATQDGIGLPGQPNSAYAGQDYVATSGTLAFAPGELTKTITVEIIENDSLEYDEFFWVRLSGATVGVITVDGQGVILGELGALDL
jgi:hypothetical protein